MVTTTRQWIAQHINPAAPSVGDLLADDAGVQAVRDALMLGWNLTELASRVRIANSLSQRLQKKQSQQEADYARAALGDPLQMLSTWRSLFTQIDTIHARRFPTSTTALTVYEPPDGTKGWRTLFPYLYADASEDAPAYANIGLAPFVDERGTPFPPAFSLYEVTRRALNSLGMLYAKPDDPLISDIVCTYQQQLCQKIIATQQSAQQATQQATQQAKPPAPDGASLCAALDVLTQQTAYLLEGWAAYLLEHYYAGGNVANDATELLAYQAGQALSAMSWEVSVATAASECVDAPSDGDLEAIYEAWVNVFATHRVVSSQHYVSALSAALDNAYYRVTGAPQQRPATGATPINASLPSSACAAVARSLDFWRRAVVWLAPSPAGARAFGGIAVARALRGALIEQSSIWEELLTGHQRLEAFTVESVMTRLVQDVTDQVVSEAVDEVGRSAQHVWRVTARQMAPVLIVTLVVIAIVAVPAILWVLLVHPSVSALNPNGVWALLGLGPLVAAVGGWLGLRASIGMTSSASATMDTSKPASPTSTSPLFAPQGALATFFAQVSDKMAPLVPALLTMLQAGWQQVRVELAGLNYAVGVAYPLVNCFVEVGDAPLATITSDFMFMEQVIWTTDERKAEVEDVVRAAFGPIGMLIHARLGQSA